MRDEYRDKIDKYREKISKIESEYNVLLRDNQRREELQKTVDKYRSALDAVRDFLTAIGEVDVAVDNEAARYKEQRLKFINDVITDALLQIFPNEGFRANVVIDRKRGRETVSLELIDKNGMVSLPEIGQGMLMQYVISYAAISSINTALGGDSLFIDEAFGVASVDRLPELGALVAKRSEGQMVVLVAQNPALYDNLQTHRIVLSKSVDGVTSVVEEIDD